MKIKDFLERAKVTHKVDKWVNVYDNTTGWSPLDIGFFLEDLDEVIDNPVMDREIDTKVTRHLKGQTILNIGFDGRN